MTLDTGSAFAGFTIDRLLGTGSMGAVYLVTRPGRSEPEALKLLDGGDVDSSVFRARFEREADLARRIGHPNIVPVLDRGADHDQLWLATEYIDGPDASRLTGTELSPQRAVAIIADAARGIDYAHSRGLLHRDIKPANILIGDDRALVTDFGIAHSMDDARYAHGGETPAALAYTAPEQLEGHAVDHRADVYALGCVLYELLTDTVPFPRWNPLAMVNAHMTEPPPHPTDMVSTLPPAMNDVIVRALAKYPSERFNSCTELADAAAAALRENDSPDVDFGSPEPPHSRRPIVLALIAAVAIVAIAAGVVFATRPPSGEQPAAAQPTSSQATQGAAAPAFTATNQRVQGRTGVGSYDVTIPQVAGQNAAAATAFNDAIRSSLKNQAGVAAPAQFTLSGNRSSVVHASDHVISGLLLTDWNSAGAQPTSLIATTVIDADTAKPITLDSLFTNTYAGLQRLSARAAELLPATKAGTGFLRAGIAPTTPNFTNWLATPAGMSIRFDQGQVASPDSGLIDITIPWSVLADVMDPALVPIVSS
ncbi:serine/threonine-protein kinase [Antrihabitans cavernicola]|uniref:non-specific serine/threonine protein kinase n=1 Tax=Antrihabitans cavernicola TaxID=2495913 RepID=A0A5A7S4Y8_9NOCA|nr:serine/threonine-protein kinase [Spelaeibacter cavernicola]KAA0021240.1 protein kinase [Spelaeibacter cavernicola]